MRTRLVVSCLPALLWLAGCDIEGFDSAQRYTQEFHQTYNVKPGGRLSVENFNGSVDVTGWDQNSVEISGHKYASTPEARDAIKIDIAVTGDVVQVRTVRPSARHGNMGASYVIKVPRQMQLDKLSSSNGSVRVENIEGVARIKTTNGALRATNIKGDVEAQTSNASIDVTNVEGATDLHTSNGRVKAEGVRGSLIAQTTNGGIDADLVGGKGARALKLETSNGGIDLKLGYAPQNDVRASTSNAGITVRLPGNANARLKAITSNSSVSTEFEVKVQGTANKNQMDGTIGNGGPLLELSTTNGGIRVQKI
jgi:DUF4097 and DUF4098 domain-containing protein YvlB